MPWAAKGVVKLMCGSSLFPCCGVGAYHHLLRPQLWLPSCERVRVRVPNTKIARSRCCARERRSAMSAVFGDARQRMLCRCMRSCSKKGVCSVSVRRMCEVRVWGRA